MGGYMHIPDGYLSPKTYIPAFGVSLFFWGVAMRVVRKTLSSRSIPYLALSAAFSFLVMMFNVPEPGGTTGHAVGGAIASLLIGPWAAVISISIVLIIQALFFGDGGITAIGANSFNMAVLMPFVSYLVFKGIAGRSREKRRLAVAAFLSGYVGLNVAALCTAILFGIQPYIAHSPQGVPLYAPYPLQVAVPAMLVPHLLIFGVVEGIITSLVFLYLYSRNPMALYVMRSEDERP